MCKRLIISVSLLALKMKVLKPCERLSLEPIPHPSKHLITPRFANGMCGYLIPPSINTVLLYPKYELIEHLIMFTLMNRPDSLSFDFSLLVGTKTLVFHGFAGFFHLHYHLLLLTLFLVGCVLFPVLEVRENVVVVHSDDAVLYLGVHFGLE